MMASTPETETSHKVSVGGRYLGTFAAGGLTLFVAIGTITPENQTAVLSSAQTIYKATHDIIGALANIWYIVFPAIAGLLAKFGIDASGWGTMITRVLNAAKAGDKSAAVDLVVAASSPEIGTKAIINPELASDPSTSSTVAASVSSLPAAVKEDIK